MNPFSAYASVILDLSLNKVLEYGITPEQLPLIKKGMRVEVPVRGFPRPGYVLEVKEKPNFSKVKGISKLLSESELISDDLFTLSLWISRYYCTPLRNVFRMLLPTGVRKSMAPKEQLFVMRGKSKEELRQFCIQYREQKTAQVEIIEVLLKAKKGMLLSKLIEESKSSRSSVDALAKQGLVVLDIVRIDRSPLLNEEYFQTKPKTLNEEQATALNKIIHTLETFKTHLLYGITGSGKTEIYLQAIEKALEMDKGTIMLVPEISLTQQTIERFKSRFKEKIAILHHRLSVGERNDEWHQIKEGKAKIVIGARSAIFSPVVNLGLIIVDEEHEQSYKQNESSPSYHARDVAVMRGKISHCTVVLGSATPSLESYYNAQSGKYILSELQNRAETTTLPQVTIVDMKKEYEKNKGFTNFSELLLDKIKKRQEKGEQTILFLNRRGYHTTLRCPDCQHTVKCAHCDVPMTFHLNENQLHCHLCGYQLVPPKICFSCKSGKPLKFRGVGTELIEKSLYAIFPELRIIRLDADTTRHKGSHQKLLKEFGTGKADVMIGTQMIAKGLHFPEVTLVGVLNSDSALNIPDFRASETVFQLITQVAGRAGRGIVPGEVIIQTTLPKNETIQFASKQDYVHFYQSEIGIREAFAYPPFIRLAKIIFSGLNAENTLKIANELRERLGKKLPSNFELNPVVPCGYSKVKDRYRFQCLLKANNMCPLNGALQEVMSEFPLPKEMKMHIDVDPTSTFF